MPRFLKVLASSVFATLCVTSLHAQTNPLAVFTFPSNSVGVESSEAAAGYYAYIGAGGTVFVYENNAATGGTGWSEVSEISSPSKTPESFGVALAASASELAIADPGLFSQSGAYAAGAVYVYGREGNTVKLRKTLYEPTPSEGDAFGESIALSGSWMVIGAPGAGSHGVAYLYHDAGKGFELVGQVEGSDEYGGFGSSVAILGPTIPGSGAAGVEIAVGEPRYPMPTYPENAGKAFAYTATISGSEINRRRLLY